MPLPKLNSREVEAPIQKAIQGVGSGVEPSIRKASGVRALPPSTVAHRLAGRLPQHLAYKSYCILIKRVKLLNRYTNISPRAF